MSTRERWIGTRPFATLHRRQFGLVGRQRRACGAPWLSATPTQLNLGALGTADVTVGVDSSQFGGAASKTGYLCLQSNDATTPVTVVRVSATQH